MSGRRKEAARRRTCLLISLALIVAGIAWRTLPLGLPRFAHKYGGSFLWGAMLYWVVAALLPRLHPLRTALLTAVIAVFVELSRLYHTPGLDAFRATLAGRLLLGQHFAVTNMAVYWVGIAAAMLIDRVHYWPSRHPTPLPTSRKRPAAKHV